MSLRERETVHRQTLISTHLSELLKILSDEVLRDEVMSPAPSSRVTVIDTAMAQLAIDQGLGGLLYLIAQRGYPLSLTDDRLEIEWLRRAAGELARGVLLSEHWPLSSPPPLLIKGADLNARLYQSRGLGGGRASSDWDLLLPEPDYHSVITAWRERFGEPTCPRSARLPDESPYELGFYIEGLLFEVHRAVCPPFYNQLSSEMIYARAQKYQSSWGQEVLEPCSIDRLLIWLINFGRSGGANRLLDWIDLAMILHSLYLLNSPSEVGERLRERSLEVHLKDAWSVMRSTPLTRVVEHRYMADIFKAEPQRTPEVLINDEAPRGVEEILKHLTRHERPLEIKLYQIKYCEPPLRADYLRRGILKTLRSKALRFRSDGGGLYDQL